MRRRTLDALLATGGLVVAIVLAVAGGLLVWGHNFVDHNVHTQLAAQKVFFPPKGSDALKGDPEITKYVTPYAGQQVVTGQQAEVFANHYIAVHLREAAGGQTYSQVSEKYIGLLASDPKSPKLAGLAATRQTLFMGETLRGLLLNAYAFGKMGTIAGIAAIVSFAGAGLMLLLAGLGFVHGRRTPVDAEVHPLGARSPAPLEA